MGLGQKSGKRIMSLYPSTMHLGRDRANSGRRQTKKIEDFPEKYCQSKMRALMRRLSLQSIVPHHPCSGKVRIQIKEVREHEQEVGRFRNLRAAVRKIYCK